MSLAKPLNAHLDEMDALEQQFKDEIDIVVKSIDKKMLIKNPAKALTEAVNVIKQLMMEKYMPLASKQGFDIADTFKDYKKQGKDIIIDDSSNPKENEGLVYDNGKNQD